MARKTKEEALVTREIVLLAALDLFGEKGYSRTTFSDIGKRIGMTRGAVYWHFENKPALLAGLIEFARTRRDEQVGMGLPEVKTLEDLRYSFIHHARIVAEDELIRKFEFFMNYQVDWSEELLTETENNLASLRQSPMDEFRACFKLPGIANRFKPTVDVETLILTLAAFWLGLCKLYLGRCPGVDFGKKEDADPSLSRGFALVETIGQGFDLIVNSALKEGH